MTGYRAAIDIGGTFTDLVLAGGDGRVRRAKVPSTPDDYARGVLEGLGQVLERAGISPGAVEAVLHGTTVGTNAILEGRGARVGLLTTRGFRDVLEIGRLRRASLHDLSWNPPRPLVRRAWRLEVAERVDARGQVIVPLDPEEVRARVAWLRREGIEALAVCLINAHANPTHEQAIARLVRAEHPDLPLSVSSEIAPVAREYERTSTAVVNAYIGPAVVTYLRRLEAGLRAAGIPGRLWVMQSNGGLLGAEAACRAPVLLVESGPAAGVWGAAAFAREASGANLIALDMGGTTAKASLLEGGDPARVATLEVGAGMNAGDRLLRGVGYPIHVPAFDLAEVGAGGGSIAWVDAGGALRVGPQSAGAVPGPACYGQGGTEPTVTDAYVVLGYVNPTAMAGGRLKLSPERAERAIADRIAKPLGLSVREAAHGIFEVAKANMIRAIKAVSTERGRDPAEFGLLAFGGAGPVHAAALAEALDMDRVMCPAAPGLFSAVGMLLAEAKRDFAATLLRRLDALEVPTIQAAYEALEAAARSTLRAEGFGPEALTLARSAELRYVGQDFELRVPVPSGRLGPAALEELAEAFAREHERAFGHRNAGEPVVLVTARVHAASSIGAGGHSGDPPHPSPLPLGGEGAGEGPSHAARLGQTRMDTYREIGARLGSAAGRGSVRPAYFGPDEGMREAIVLEGRGGLVGTLRGPAIIEEEDATTVVPPGWQACLEAGMALGLTRVPSAERPTVGRRRRAGDPVTFELLRHALLSTVQAMGLAIVRTAYSVGVRDIMDFGTALCDAEGRIVAQAQTMAIHLGAIPPALAAVRRRFGEDLRPGDIVILNDPYHGGMHLADIFMFEPLFLDGRLVGFAAITAHQVDMGGSVPGGNAAGLTEIYQEGLRLPPLKLVEGGRQNETLMAMIQRNVRIPHQVAGDLRSMMAGCHAAGQAVTRLAARYGRETLAWAMAELLAYAERMARAEIARFPEGPVIFEDHLDDDGVSEAPVRIRVTLTVRDGRVQVDFAGSSDQVRGGINATLSVAQSAAYFALRCAMTSDVPDNSGYYGLVQVTAPEGSVVNPRFPACCAAKGVTAFRVCDAILGALAGMLPERMAAAGEGGATIVTFGGRDQAGGPFVLMDLVLGGMGGRPDRDGVEGIANPSCNVRNTPVEILEATFPIRVEAYGFVPDSGGAGRFRGALSICRAYRFLGRDGVLQVRSDRHRHLPYGVAGGCPGTPSRNALVRAGTERVLPPKFVIPIQPGDLFRHVQAGAGGYGPPSARDPQQVREDVRDGKVSAEYARGVYGVSP